MNELSKLTNELRELREAVPTARSWRRLSPTRKRQVRAEICAQTQFVRDALAKVKAKIAENRLRRRYPDPPMGRFITPVKDFGDRLADRELEEKLFDARRARAAASIR